MVQRNVVENLREQQSTMVFIGQTTPDYKIFATFKNDTSKLTLEFYNKYKGLLVKKAYLYERNSRGKIQAEDFISECYLSFYAMVKQLKEEKMNPEKFMFYQYAVYAISKTLHKYRKVYDREVKSINDDTNYDQYGVEDHSEYVINEVTLPAFYAKLTERQRYIIEQSKQGKTYDQIRKVLKCSHGTIAGDIWRARNTMKETF